MWNSEVTNMILKGIWETIEMSFFSTVFGYLIGLPVGVLCAVSDKDGIHPNAPLYRVLDFIINVLRSIPFLILLILLIPFTTALVGVSYGTKGTIVPLVISAAPFIARMVESSIKEVDHGVIEAAQSMGAGNWTIITKVLLGEARVSLVVGVTIVFATVLGYSAMAGVVGGGGLGDIAIRYGYYRYQADIMIVCVVLLVVLTQVFQAAGMKVAGRIDRRRA
jgi:D-methionine transport system permease protein